MRRLLLPVMLLGLVLAACSGSAVTPTQTSTPAPGATPTSSPTSSIDAAPLFLQNCAPCHGAQREGVVGPALKAADLQARGRTDQYIRDTITNGRGGMPSWKDKLTPAQIEALMKFLRT